MVASAALLAFWIAATGILAVFVLNPMAILLAGAWRRARERPVTSDDSEALPAASLICAFRGTPGLVRLKLADAERQVAELPGLEVILVSDGPPPAGLPEDGGAAVRILATAERRGKNAALNLGVASARSEILVFSDVDARVAPAALRSLLARFADPAVGGVCGRRVISGDGGRSTGPGQRLYLDGDQRLKSVESRLGSITASEGKLMAIRRELFEPIDPRVADDIFLALGVVAQGRRFVYEPAARAEIPMPSRSPAHEITRRRRIVAGSLRALWLKRAVLNPLRFGGYALRLFTNKVLRRLLPIFLVLLLLGSAVLAVSEAFFRGVLLLQIAFYVLAAVAPLLLATRLRGTLVGGLVSAAAYFCFGNLGTLLGTVDFLRGRDVAAWEPAKEG